LLFLELQISPETFFYEIEFMLASFENVPAHLINEAGFGPTADREFLRSLVQEVVDSEL